MTDQIPALYPGVPGAPRTETVVYGTGDRPPFVAQLPNLKLNHRELHDAICGMAATAIRSRDSLRQLSNSEPHIKALCEAMERLDIHDAEAVASRLAAEQQLAVAQGLAATALRKASEAEALRVAALADAQQQREQAIRLSEENRALRLDAAAMSARVVDAADAGHFQSTPTRKIARVDQPARMRAAYAMDFDTCDLDTIVVEPPYGGES